MKNLTATLCAAALGGSALTGCSDVTLGHFSVDEEIPESTVQGIGLSQTLPLTFATFPMDVTSQAAYQQEDFDYLTEVSLRRLVLSIDNKSDMPEHDAFEDGNDDNFDFLSSLEISVEAVLDGQEQSVVVARLTEDDPQIASGTRELQLTTTGADILDFIEAEGGYEVTIDGRGTVPPDDVIYAGKATYRLGLGFR
ncbi:MAG: hypothetical protein AAF404_20010 [Pseudomonadota bacterium]